MALDPLRTSRNERLVILLLCFIAIIRVLVFSAAFPFFSNIDEDLHFDLITQYSHGLLPRSFDRLKAETLDWIVPYASPEFLFSAEQFPERKFPTPLWKRSDPKVGPEIMATRDAWSSEMNFEAAQPPLYYTLASAWWWIGKHLGLVGIQSLYWIRFLNVFLIAIVVWLGYVIARAIAPERMELRIGVPLVLAFIPQSIFYAMNNDVLSPVCFGALFLCLVRWSYVETASLGLGIVTGFAVAATYLAKLSNLPLIAVALVVIVGRLLVIGRRTPRAGLAALAALFICAAIPIGAWLVWTRYQFGDLTGSTEKISLLGWTRKPVADWWQHPIFSLRGSWIFWSDLVASFWRGEVTWHGHSLSWQIADGFYAVSSLFFLAAAMVGLRKQAGLSAFQQRAIGSAILIFVAGVLCLALLSIQFDFGNCIYPSRAHPYFTSGRLLSGALVPFALLYVYGIVSLLHRVSGAVLPVAIVIGLVIFVTTSEMVINRVVFPSEHNWFHR